MPVARRKKRRPTEAVIREIVTELENAPSPPKNRRGPGRPKRLIPPDVANIYLNCLRCGDSTERAAFITGISADTWLRRAHGDPVFAEKRRRSMEMGAGFLTGLAYQAMVSGIAAGDPWFIRLGIASGKIALVDPDSHRFEGRDNQAVGATTINLIQIVRDLDRSPSADNIPRKQAELTRSGPAELVLSSDGQLVAVADAPRVQTSEPS